MAEVLSIENAIFFERTDVRLSKCISHCGLWLRILVQRYSALDVFYEVRLRSGLACTLLYILER